MIESLQRQSLIKSVDINQSFYHVDVFLVLRYKLLSEMRIFRYLKEKEAIGNSWQTFPIEKQNKINSYFDD